MTMNLHTTTVDGTPVVVTLEPSARRAGESVLTVREDRNDGTGWKAPVVMAVPVAHVSALILSDTFGPAVVTEILASL